MVLDESVGVHNGPEGRTSHWASLDLLKGSLYLSLGFFEQSNGDELTLNLGPSTATTKWLKQLKDPE